MTQLKSNSLAVLAASISSAISDAEVLAAESVDRMIDAGRMLCVAKSECKHGEWLPFLKRAGVAERKAQRLMQLARSGFKSDTVTDLGGVKETLAFLSERRLPNRGHSLCVTCHSDVDNPFRAALAAFIWPSEQHHDHFFVAGFREKSDGGTSVIYTKRAISGEEILADHDRFVSPVWALVERAMVVPPANWHFYPNPSTAADVIARVLSLDHTDVARIAA